MRAIVTGINKNSSYAEYLGLTYNVTCFLSAGNKLIFSLSINGIAVDFTAREITIVDFDLELQQAYETLSIFNNETNFNRYNALCLYASLKGIKYQPEHYYG